MNRYYNIADVSYCISGDSDAMNWDEGVLALFGTDNKICSRHIEINVTEKLDGPEGECIFTDEHKQVFCSENGAYIRYEGVVNGDLSASYMRIERKGALSFVQVKPLCLGSKSVMTAMEIEHAVVENSGVLFHAASICTEGKAIVFTAPSGVGKSTQADLWCKLRSAQLVNGDRCVIRHLDGSCYLSGVPYCGSSRVSHNLTLPLGAIVYLTQSPESQAHVTKGIESFRYLWEGCCINTFNSSDMEKSLELVTKLAENVPVIRLDCTPDATAVEVLENLLKELNVIGN